MGQVWALLARLLPMLANGAKPRAHGHITHARSDVRTRTQARTHAPICAHARADVRARTRRCARIGPGTCLIAAVDANRPVRTDTLTHTCVHAYTTARTHAQTHACTHTSTRAHTHARAHTRSHTDRRAVSATRAHACTRAHTHAWQLELAVRSKRIARIARDLCAMLRKP